MVRLRLIGVDVGPGLPSPLEQRPRPKIALVLEGLLHRLHAEIKAHLQTSILYDEVSPPPPPANELDLVLRWRELYHPTMTNKQLAERIAMPYQTLRNTLSWRKQGARVPRGAPRGDGEGERAQKGKP